MIKPSILAQTASQFRLFYESGFPGCGAACKTDVHPHRVVRLKYTTDIVRSIIYEVTHEFYG
jgi:hypothetical protein